MYKEEKTTHNAYGGDQRNDKFNRNKYPKPLCFVQLNYVHDFGYMLEWQLLASYFQSPITPPSPLPIKPLLKLTTKYYIL